MVQSWVEVEDWVVCCYLNFFFNKKHILGLKITDFIEAEK